jgi:hypothetical protein
VGTHKDPRDFRVPISEGKKMVNNKNENNKNEIGK